MKKVLVALAAVLVIGGGGIYGWSSVCPCDRTPGLVLMGSASETPVNDWRFIDDVPLCQVQVWGRWGPISVNLTCMATPEGELFLSCSTGAQKYWCNEVGANEAARLRANGTVYPVVLTRELDPVTLDRAWRARVKKLQAYNPSGAPVPAEDARRPDSWWSFRARSAPAA
jgi:hypothetical protein